MKKILYIFFIFIFINNLQAQDNSALWKPINESEIVVSAERTIIPKLYKTYHLIDHNLKTLLFSSPNEKNMALANSPVIIELPLPDGSIQQFRVVESPVMTPELAAQFPNIKTFNVKSTDGANFFGKLDWNDFGFHAMIRMPAGDIFIDPYCRNNVSDYISYYTADFKKDASKIIPEKSVIIPEKVKKKEDFSIGAEKKLRVMICAGENLRTFRLAVACTGEYAQAATGLSSPSVSQILSVVVTTVNRVDGVYETEVAVKLILVSNETSILYADENNDPFAGNDDASILIAESQTVIDNLIGDANYDIGHTFSTGGGGLAYLGCVCYSGIKASAITGGSNPVGDPYDIDYVAHEIGHQFSGNHTFTSNTGSCSGNANLNTEMEPGSGVTIMAYAGICDINNVALNSIAYFHSVSFDEIMEFTTNANGSICPVITSTGNNAPVVTGSATYTIPQSTPFILTGSATDINGDVLTYQWEENDLGLDNDWNSGAAPYFRSYAPVSSPSRMFPKLNVVLSGYYNDTIGEYLPSTPQTLKFIFTARDNKMGGGGICYASSQVIIASSGPFAVSSPNTTGIVWAENSSQTVTWSVNGTNLSPVSCSNVNILLSINGGLTFSTLLANTPNDGSQLIIVPIVGSTKSNCRIKVESIGNVFLDINDHDFTITSLISDIITFQTLNSIIVKFVPNPFTNEIQLSINGLDKKVKTNLIVYDVLGNVLMTDIFIGKDEIDQKYDLSLLSKGVYVIEVSNAKQKRVSRLVKQ